MQFTNLFRYNGTDKDFSVRECKNGGGSRMFEDPWLRIRKTTIAKPGRLTGGLVGRISEI